MWNEYIDRYHYLGHTLCGGSAALLRSLGGPHPGPAWLWRPRLENRPSRPLHRLASFGTGEELDAGAADGARGLTNIGTQKQLFIDDYIVERTSHVKRVLNHGVKAPNNPVVKADQPWETNYLRLNKIVYDDKDGLFKMWYSATDEFKPKKGPGAGHRWKWTLEGDNFTRVKVPDPYSYYGDPNGDGSKLCLATSKDGVHWEKPNLGKVEYKGSRDNNILPPGSRIPTLLDPNESDPSRRYKAVASGYKFTAYHYGQINVFYSADGFEWRPASENKEMDIANKKGRWGPNKFMGWDPIKGYCQVNRFVDLLSALDTP